MEKELGKGDIIRLKTILFAEQNDLAFKAFGILVIIFASPLIPSRRNKETAETIAQYFFKVLIISILIIPIFIYHYYRNVKNLKLDLNEKKKVAHQAKIIKKERSFTNNKFYIFIEGKDIPREVKQREYEQINQGDIYIIWKSKNAKIELHTELISKS